MLDTYLFVFYLYHLKEYIQLVYAFLWARCWRRASVWLSMQCDGPALVEKTGGNLVTPPRWSIGNPCAIIPRIFLNPFFGESGLNGLQMSVLQIAFNRNADTDGPDAFKIHVHWLDGQMQKAAWNPCNSETAGHFSTGFDCKPFDLTLKSNGRCIIGLLLGGTGKSCDLRPG